MTKKRTTLNDEILATSAENVRRYGHDNSEMDSLNAQIKRLYHDRKHTTQTVQFKHDVKAALLNMLHKLDRSAPHFLYQGGRTADLTAALPGMEPHKSEQGLAHALNMLENIQDMARYTQQPAERDRCNSQSRTQVNVVLNTLESLRASIMPLRPRIKLNNRAEAYVFSQVEPGLYNDFVRSFAASAIVDRKQNPGIFAHLPNIDAITKETQAFMAVLDFAETVKDVLNQCKHPTSSEQKFWKENRAVLHKQLVEAVDKFNATIRPLRLKVNATSPAYQECVRAEERILKAVTYDGVFDAYKAIKHHGFLFVLGGEDKIHNVHHHKLISRIGEAYRQDRKLIRQAESDYEHHHDSDRYPYSNPLLQPGHTFNRIYEARWTLAADKLKEMVEAYAITIADPTIAAPSQQPAQEAPLTHIMTKSLAARLNHPEKAGASHQSNARHRAGDTYTVRRIKEQLKPNGNER